MPSARYTRNDVVVPIAGPLDEAQRLVSQWVSPPLQGQRWDFVVDRLVLDIADEELAPYDWEAMLRARHAPGIAVVRSSPVRPRVRSIGLTFPMRILEIGGPAVVPDVLRMLFRGRSCDYAITTAAAATLENAAGVLPSSGWPTAEILHLRDASGTAGSLLRLANTWQTRLIILEGDAGGMPELRTTAHAIVTRGGPAVWLFERGQLDVVNVYASIIHDRPLDWIQQSAGGTLFAGKGREELLRYSTLGEQLAEAAPPLPPADVPRRPLTFTPSAKEFVAGVVRESMDDLRIARDDDTIPWLDDVGCMRLDDSISSGLAANGLIVPPLDGIFRGARGANVFLNDVVDEYERHTEPAGTARADNAIDKRVAQFRELMPQLEFESHETDGMLPLAQKVTSIRRMRHASEVMTGDDLFELRGKDDFPPPRAVNAWFALEGADATPLRIEQAGARLVPGADVNLAVSIGARDLAIETAGTTDLLEERIEYDPQAGGTWIEIGVTGIDFDVLGDPVQEVWLPKHDDMKTPVFFAVRPRHETTVKGVARLRIAIYHRNNVVQSFLMAALLTNADGDGASLLGRVLNGPVKTVRDPGYLVKLEYSAGGVDDAGKVQERALSIIANESAGEKVVTVKGEDLFTARRGASLPPKVDAARGALERASMSGGSYRYTFDPNVQNSGNPQQLLDSLWDMALAGWDLFNFLVPSRKQQEKVRERLGRGGGVHAAHLDLSNVIPWSLLYDRPVEWTGKLYEDASDPNAPVFDLRRDLCPAGMPDAEGTVSQQPCGQEPRCLLTPANLEAEKKAGGNVVCEKTVICPRRFWGFTQPIEVPVQQSVDDDAEGKSPAPLRTVIESTQPAEIVAGFNEHLPLAGTHRAAIEAFCAAANAKLVTAVAQNRDAIQQVLTRTTPAIVYIYCHAYPEAVEGTSRIGPNLSFGPKPTIRDALTASQLSGDPWTHHPLVFLNGCGTVGFDPCAPSEFITQFVQGREAAAVIGTEVTVWEVLAGEVASEFLQAFVTRKKSAGEALLRVRGKLLAKGNPLGLVYTLYGSSSLTVDWK